LVFLRASECARRITAKRQTICSAVSITDLHATLFTAMGISPATAFDIEKRPFYATNDGKGVAVRDVFYSVPLKDWTWNKEGIRR
jgi:hypothetical protein